MTGFEIIAAVGISKATLFKRLRCAGIEPRRRMDENHADSVMRIKSLKEVVPPTTPVSP